jgi:hypothetical protein
MPIQLPDASPRLNCLRHAALLAAAILGIALARSIGPLPIVLAFACYGAVHAAALGFCLRPRPAAVRVLAFVSAAALQSGLLARLGVLALPLLARSGAAMAALFVVAASAVAGALGYGGLLRWLLKYWLAWGPLAMIALTCMFAATAGLLLMRQYPVGGSAWPAILWWIAFSGGLCAAARRPGCAHDTPGAPRQRMP